MQPLAPDAYTYLTAQANAQNTSAARYIVFRHGQSQANVHHYVGGQTPTSVLINREQVDLGALTETGRIQAQHLGMQLKATGISIAHADTSPLQRAQDTLEEVLSALGQQVTVQEHPALLEKHFGRNENATGEEYGKTTLKEQSDFETITSWQERFSYKVYPEDSDLESLEQVYERAKNTLLGSCQNRLGQNSLVSTHNVVMKALLMGIQKGYGYEVGYRTFDLMNCCVLVIEVNERGDLRLVAASGICNK